MTNKELAQQFRELARVYEDNPDAIRPSSFGEGLHEYIFCRTLKEVSATLHAFGAGKKVDGTPFILFYPEKLPSIIVAIDKTKICKCIKVGERDVAEQVIPAKAEVVIPAHKEEVYEWECGSLLRHQTEEQIAEPTAKPTELPGSE